MNLKTQRRIAADVLKAGKTRVWLNPERKEDIKKAITKNDIKELVKQGAIAERPKVGVSRARAKHIAIQKSKGRRKGKGSRTGKRTARLPDKKDWMTRIRAQRGLLTTMKQHKLIDDKVYREMRQKAKGGFFRSKRHIKLYLEDRGLLVKKHGQE